MKKEQKEQKKRRQPSQKWWRPFLLSTVIGVVSAACYFFGILDNWNARIGDKFYLHRDPDPSILIVAIDDDAITQLGHWPWPRRIHANIINKLSESGVKAIGYDVNFSEASTAEDDQQLAEAMQKSGRVVLPIEMKADGGQGSEDLKPVTAVKAISDAAAGAGHVNTPADADGVMRRVPMELWAQDAASGTPTFAAEVARIAGMGDRAGQAPKDAQGRMWVNFDGDPHKTFHTVSAAEIMNGTMTASALKDQVVLVGATAADLHDDMMVPLSNGTPMPGVEVHASALDTLMGRRWLQTVPFWMMMIALVVIGALMGIIVPRIRMRWSLPLVVLLAGGIFWGASVAFDRGLIVEILWPEIVLLASFIVIRIERGIRSERERRQLKTAFSRYVSPAVVREVLRNPRNVRLGGERKKMTVLFSDIRGFTSISEELPPENLVEVLNTYLSRMTGIVFEHDGVLDKYIGDAVMAFWNAPFEQKDHPELAVRAALDMQDALAELNQRKAFGELELRIGIGVNSGDMIVGNVGGTTRFDFTVIGDQVNLGSRLEGLTKEYGVGVILAESTANEANTAVFCRRLDKVAVKGKKEPVMIYEALCLQEHATPEQKALAHAYEKAWDLYAARDFAAAREACEALLAQASEDGPTRNLKSRCEQFLQVAPQADWDGTWVFTKK